MPKFTDNFNTQILVARYLVNTLLDNQVDKQGKPLIDHCERVFAICQRMKLSEDQQLAGLLHDCVEDGKLKRFDDHELRVQFIYCIIEQLFGAQVTRIVSALTRQKSDTYEKYIELIGFIEPDAVQVKLADLEDNLDENRLSQLDSKEQKRLRGRYVKAKDYLLKVSEPLGRNLV